MARILYIDNPGFDGRADLADTFRQRLGAEVVVVDSIEDYAKLHNEGFDLFVSGDSMLFQGRIVQGWESLRKHISKTSPDDLLKLVVLSNRDSVIEDANLSQVAAFNKRTGLEQFFHYAQAHLEAAAEDRA